MISRAAQDVILRLLADGPYRAVALGNGHAMGPEIATVLSKVDLAALDRFGRFLCRHYYRERVVHYFKYCRALASRTGRPPEGVLKTAEFTALMPRLILGDHASAEQVVGLLRRHLTERAEAIRGLFPYWDDLITYQSVFFLTDALPPAHGLAPGSAGGSALPFPARAENATIVELGYDLPAILPALLRPSPEAPQAKRVLTRLLFARSPQGEVTVLRCTDALKALLDALTGREDPSQVAARMGLDGESFLKTLQKLEQLGVVVAQESFSSSHVGSDLPFVR